MDTLKDLNFIILFLVELAMLCNFAVWGFTLKKPVIVQYLIGIGAPVMVILLWGMFFSPDPAFILVQPWNAMGEYALFTLSAVAVARAGRVSWAKTFFIVAIISETIALLG
ncbi:YrdB family protein [Streptomyces caniscabiei]|uniref:YrdB family protein n=1 Tax=Streptomyces caniscabiei TaxID=2746961 RepID=UPI0029AA29BC|nr:YrdB family protein [Streptomyces caniscabiei]MDX2776042.1 YrdB family protein [Streptomyces caniscabiei]